MMFWDPLRLSGGKTYKNNLLHFATAENYFRDLEGEYIWEGAITYF